MKPRKLVIAFALIGSVSIFLQYDFHNAPTCMSRICSMSEKDCHQALDDWRPSPPQPPVLLHVHWIHEDLKRKMHCLAQATPWSAGPHERLSSPKALHRVIYIGDNTPSALHLNIAEAAMRTKLEADCREGPLLSAASSKDRTASAVLLASTYALDELCSSLWSDCGLCLVLGAARATTRRLDTGARCGEGFLHCFRDGAPCSRAVLIATMAPC